MPVKPEFIKELSKEIAEKYPEVVTTSFEKNKNVVRELTNIQSKTVRNRVAGHLTQKKRSKLKQEDTEPF